MRVKRLLKIKIIVAVAIGVSTFLVYLPSLQNGFVNWDDDDYIYENPFIRSLDGEFLLRAFLKFYDANWHPLTWVSHAVDYAVWGLDPFGHHLTSSVFHAVNALVVVLLAIRLIEIAEGNKEESGPGVSSAGGRALIAGAVTGLLFGVHPIHVESVAWVSERKDVLSALFFLLSIFFYVRHGESEDAGRGAAVRFPGRSYLSSIGLFILALLSKPMAVTLPAVLLILDWYPLRRVRSLAALKFVLIEKVPFFVLSLASSVVTILAQRSESALMSLDFAPFEARLCIGARALVSYLWKMIYPVDLIPFYPYLKGVSFRSFGCVMPVLLVIVMTGLFIGMRKKQSVCLAAWGYYAVTLLPVLGIVQVGYQSMADRYTYLPSLGPFLLIGVISGEIYERVQTLEKKAFISVFFKAAAVVAIVFLSYLTVRQTGVWRDSHVLWNYVIETKSVTAAVPFYHRGNAYSDIGQAGPAIADYNRAIALEPAYYEAYGNRGVIREKTGDVDAAIEDYTKGIALRPHAKIYNNRGNSYLAKGLPEKAIEDFDRAIAMNPEFDRAYVNRGAAHYLAGEYDKALADLDRAIELNNESGVAHVNRGYVHLKKGNSDRAVVDFQRGCALGNENACRNLRAVKR